MQSLEFFAEQDFEAVYNLEIVPEFSPPTSEDITDVSNFDEEFTRGAFRQPVTNKLTRCAENGARFMASRTQTATSLRCQGQEAAWAEPTRAWSRKGQGAVATR